MPAPHQPPKIRRSRKAVPTAVPIAPATEDYNLAQDIRALYDAIEVGNFDAIGELFHAEAVYRRPGAAPIISREKIIDFYRRKRMATTSQIMVESVITQGRQAVAVGLVEGRGKGGEPIHEQFADMYEFNDGLVKARTTYFFRPGF